MPNFKKDNGEPTLFWVGFLFIIFLICCYCCFGFTSPCPQKGSGSNRRIQYDDSLKNRPVIAGKINPSVTLDKILAHGDDTKRFTQNTFTSIVGYVALVKRGGSETCNCHSKNKSDWDTHIEIILDAQHPGTKNAMICEATRNGKIKYEDIAKLKGKKVKVSGWLFFDEEHKQNSANVNPTGTDLWRCTCWELHPVTEIIEMK